LFKFESPFLVNFDDQRVLDVSGNKDVEGQAVIVNKRHGGANQRWRVVYLDKADAIQSKGLNKDFGFHINRPFYFVSELPMNRVIEMHGNANLWLKRWRNNVKAQQFYFDGVSKTIRNN